jgi:NADPH:quinone reductase-like Zn-dependent oxidoreductase
VTVPVAQVVEKPRSVSWEVAGSLCVAGTTAYAAVEAVRAGSGDTVVVSAAAGGVGSIATQLLVARGVDVIAIASAANHDWLTSVGARPVAYEDGLEERIRELAPDGVDALLDFYGEEYVRLGLALGVAAERIDTIIAFEVANEVGAQTKGSSDATTPEILRELVTLVAEEKLEVPIDGTFPLDRVREAFDHLERHHAHGKVVLIP